MDKKDKMKDKTQERLGAEWEPGRQRAMEDDKTLSNPEENNEQNLGTMRLTNEQNQKTKKQKALMCLRVFGSPASIRRALQNRLL